MLKSFVFNLLFFTLLASQAFGAVFEKVTLWNSGDDANRVNFIIMGDGYTATEQAKFVSDAQAIVSKLFATAPFNTYKNFINVYGIKVISNQSGVTHPHTATDCSFATVLTADTFFGSTFDYGGTHRLLYPSKLGTVLAPTLQDNFPNPDATMIIVNTPEYGGAGGTAATGSAHALSGDIMIHEMGHSFGGLRDEYTYGSSPTSCAAATGSYKNATRETTLALIPWAAWIPTTTVIPTTSNLNETDVGLYLGANYCSTNWYRPSGYCKMQSLSNIFCPVCSEALISKIVKSVNLIDAISPQPLASPLVSVTLDATTPTKVFSASVLQAIGSPTVVANWSVDSVQKATGNSYTLDKAQLMTGLHTLKLSVRDSTTRVRSPSASMSANEMTWLVQVNAGVSADTTAPTLTINSPTAAQAFSVSVITVSGTASDASGISSVTVNGVVATGTTSWSASVNLVAGSNTITVVAKDASTGLNATTKTVTVTSTAPAVSVVKPESTRIGCRLDQVMSLHFGSTGSSGIICP